jgi:DNA-binding beta-propeller fold protein YncE
MHKALPAAVTTNTVLLDTRPQRLMANLLVTILGVACAMAPPSTAVAAEAGPLQLGVKIPLGDVKGRIDHMAADLARQRLFVAELGNGSLGVIDLKARKLAKRITGLKEPQGVGYVAATDTVYVANAADGSVRLFRGEELAPAGVIDLKNDADNVRVDAEKNQVLVGYGSGAIAVIDPANQKKIADIPLKAHPEGFQLSGSGEIFVNLPSVHAVGVIDRSAGQQKASWPTRDLGGNFPMTLDDAAKRVIVAFRDPPQLAVLAMGDGATVAERDTCGDSDDVFHDGKRKRVYVVCGAGFIDVFDGQGDAYQRIAHIPTVSGARTGLFIPSLDLLAVAVRASGKEPAAIWLYRAAP